MFQTEFYPTPREVSKKMVEPYSDMIRNGAMILDPSAGSGSLLDACRWLGANDMNLFAVEVDSNLCAILKDKKIRLIGQDFLQYQSHYLFDLIVMNPPFSNGDEHLLKAWDVLRDGHIACLLNSETINNPFSKKRELLAEVIRNNGTVENLGRCFKGADRSTDVDISMVRLQKVQAKKMFAFDGMQKRRNPTFQTDTIDLESQVAKSDFIGALVSSYEQVGAAYEGFMTARNKLDFYVGSLINTSYGLTFDPKSARNSCRGDERAKDMAEFNAYMDTVKFASWQTVFDRSQIRNFLTANLREQFNKFQQQAGTMEFTEANIWAFFEMLIVNREDNMQQCVVDVFDRLTSYDKKNTIHWEGWKTNSRFRVNKKVIMPWFVEFSTWGHFSLNYQRMEVLRDIDRVLCMLTGKRLDDVLTIEQALRDRFKQMQNATYKDDLSNTAISEFFDLKFYKKGTLHMVFRDEWLWGQFNLRAAKGKKWIGNED
jgi:methylase of polypeptide subunit release factors